MSCFGEWILSEPAQDGIHLVVSLHFSGRRKVGSVSAIMFKG